MTTRAAHAVLLSFALLGCLPPTALADRPAVETALADMSRAAAAADAEAYLARVSHTDPIFYKEQSNWAKDLKRKPPASVSFTIGAAREEEEPPEFGESQARFEMVTTWAMPSEKEGVEPRPRDVSFPVMFILEGGKWVYAGEDWLVLESGIAEKKGSEAALGKSESGEKKEEREVPRPRDVRFQGPAPANEDAEGRVAKSAGDPHAVERTARVKYFPGYEAVARRIVEVLPDVRDHVDEGFGGRIARVQEVKIYPSMKHLQQSIYLSYVDGLAGWNEPGEAIKILTRPTTSARALRSLLAHEYGHVATFELGPKSNDMPWWVLEGVAELSAERFVGSGTGKNAEVVVLGWHTAGKLSAWDDLADFHKIQDSTERDLQRKVYTQGQHMLMFISDTFGRDARTAWLREMSQGKSMDEASVVALKMPFAEVDAKWREALRIAAEKVAAEKAAREEKAKQEDGKDPAPAKPQE